MSNTPGDTPLRRLIANVAAGRFPAPDGAVEVIDPGSGPAQAVLAFASHHVVAARVSPSAVLAQIDPSDLGAPMSAPFLAWLGTQIGTRPGTLDIVLSAAGVADAGSLDALVAVRPVRPDLAHPRVARAVRYRAQVRTWETWDGDGLLAIGRGLAGRWEAAFEVAPGARGRGMGRGLAAAARRLIPEDDHLFVQVAPGNAPSLRAVLAAGFVPLGAEVLFLDRSRG